MARFTILGLRPGETLYCAAGRFQTSEADGGVNLTDEQRTALQDAGQKLLSLHDSAPAREQSSEEKQALANAQRTIAENKAAADRANVGVPPKDKLAPKARS